MAERKKQLAGISKARRGRDVLVIAADMTKASKTINVALDYSDILPVQDQLSVLTGTEIDIVLETPGGLAEVAQDIPKIVEMSDEIEVLREIVEDFSGDVAIESATIS